MTENIEPIARRLSDMQQRIAMQIAEKPRELREEAFAVAERIARDLANKIQIAPDDIDSFVNLQMQFIRQFVTEIDVGGKPEGGRA